MSDGNVINSLITLANKKLYLNTTNVERVSISDPAARSIWQNSFLFLSFRSKNVDFPARSYSYKCAVCTFMYVYIAIVVCSVTCLGYHHQQRHQNTHDPLAVSFGMQCPYIHRTLECTEGRSWSRCRIMYRMCHHNYIWCFAGATLELLALASAQEQGLLRISPIPTPQEKDRSLSMVVPGKHQSLAMTAKGILMVCAQSGKSCSPHLLPRNDLSPKEWAWARSSTGLVPLQMPEPAAPVWLLRSNYNGRCETRSCTCLRNGLVHSIVRSMYVYSVIA